MNRKYHGKNGNPNEDQRGQASSRGWKLFIIMLAVMGIASTTACLWFQTPLFGDQQAGRQSSAGGEYQLSGPQTDLVSSQGYPEAFIILFYEEEALDGSLEIVRLETWNYYTSGESYTFLNGELNSNDRLEVGALGSLVVLPYVPEQFSARMTLDDVLGAAGVEEFVEVPLEKEFLEGGDLYYAESLAFGLVDGELRYLEALALVEE